MERPERPRGAAPAGRRSRRVRTVLAPLDDPVERCKHRRPAGANRSTTPCAASASAVRRLELGCECRSSAARRSGRSRGRRPAASRRPGRARARTPSRRPSPARRRAAAPWRTRRAFGLASYPHASRKRKCASCASSSSSRSSVSFTPRWLISRYSLSGAAACRPAIATLIRSLTTSARTAPRARRHAAASPRDSRGRPARPRARVRLVLHRVRARDGEPAHPRRRQTSPKSISPRTAPSSATRTLCSLASLWMTWWGRGSSAGTSIPRSGLRRSQRWWRRIPGCSKPASPRSTRDRAAEALEVAGRLGPRMAVEPGEQPHDTVARAPRRPSQARHRGLVAQVLEHRVLEREVRSGVVHLEHVARTVRVEPVVVVVLAGSGVARRRGRKVACDAGVDQSTRHGPNAAELRSACRRRRLRATGRRPRSPRRPAAARAVGIHTRETDSSARVPDLGVLGH